MKGFKPKKGIVKDAAMLVAGGIGAKLVKNLGKKFITNATMQKFLPALPLVVGVMLSGNKKMEMIAYGMITTGGDDMVGAFIPSLAGIEDMDLSGIFGPLDGPLNDGMDGPLNDDMNGPLNDDMNGHNDQMADDMNGADYEHY